MEFSIANLNKVLVRDDEEGNPLCVIENPFDENDRRKYLPEYPEVDLDLIISTWEAKVENLNLENGEGF